MEKLNDFNARRAKELEGFKASAHKAGVLCPDCGVEMRFSNPGVMIATDPPRRAVHCPACNFRSYTL